MNDPIELRALFENLKIKKDDYLNNDSTHLVIANTIADLPTGYGKVWCLGDVVNQYILRNDFSLEKYTLDVTYQSEEYVRFYSMYVYLPRNSTRWTFEITNPFIADNYDDEYSSSFPNIIKVDYLALGGMSYLSEMDQCIAKDILNKISLTEIAQKYNLPKHYLRKDGPFGSSIIEMRRKVFEATYPVTNIYKQYDLNDLNNESRIMFLLLGLRSKAAIRKALEINYISYQSLRDELYKSYRGQNLYKRLQKIYSLIGVELPDPYFRDFFSDYVVKAEDHEKAISFVIQNSEVSLEFLNLWSQKDFKQINEKFPSFHLPTIIGNALSA